MNNLSAAHCYLLHSDDILYRRSGENAKFEVNPFATKVLEDDNEEKKGDDGDSNAPISIDWGKHILEWLPFGVHPRFASFLEEMLKNPESTLNKELMEWYETECAVKIEEAKSRGIVYTKDELLCLKLYSDTNDLQAAFRRAHWVRTPQEVKRSFYNWGITMYRTFLFHAIPTVQLTLYHGLNRMFMVDDVSPFYNGPFSTTSERDVARSFSQGNGLEFTVGVNHINPLKLVIGVDMKSISCHPNEHEVLLYSQTIPISKTKAFETDDDSLVDHLMFSLKEMKEPITNQSDFYRKIGIKFKNEWLALILRHEELFKTSQCSELTVLQRLHHELGVLNKQTFHNLESFIFFEGFHIFGFDSKSPFCSFKYSIDDIAEQKEFPISIHDVLNSKIPVISPILNLNGKATILRIYGKSSDDSSDFIRCKRIKWNKPFSRYRLSGDVLIGSNEAIECTKNNEKWTENAGYLIIETDGMFSNQGKLSSADAGGGAIAVFTAKTIINDGSIECSDSNATNSSSDAERFNIVVISTNDVFENSGVIGNGSNTHSFIRCSSFIDSGYISSEPFILIDGAFPAPDVTLDHFRGVVVCGESLVFDGRYISVRDGVGDELKWIISNLVFTVSIDLIGIGKEFTFTDIESDRIPIECPGLIPNGHSVTLRIYGKPIDESFDFSLCKMIKWQGSFARYRVGLDYDVVIESDVVIEAADERQENDGFIIIETKRRFSNKGTVRSSGIAVGALAVFADANILNDGIMECSEFENDDADGSGAIVISTNGCFENKGVIANGVNTHSLIQCTDFVDSGVISTEPFIVIDGAFPAPDVTLDHFRDAVVCGESLVFNGRNLFVRDGVDDEIKSKISKFIFTVSIDHIGDGKEFTFTDIESDRIPIVSPILNPNGRAVTLRIYAKTKDGSFDYALCRMVKWKGIFSRYKTSGDLIVGSDEVVETEKGNKDSHSKTTGYIEWETAGRFSNDGVLRSVEVNGGMIIVSASKGVQNGGNIECGASKSDDNGGNIGISTDGAFVNNGVIECGVNGMVIVFCSEFEDNGLIAPRPDVVIGNEEIGISLLQRIFAEDKGKHIELTVRKHRGHYWIHHPQNLLKEGIGDKYHSYGCGPPNEDWIVFEHDEESRFIPTTVIIRNYNYSSGIKRIAIYGGNNIDDLEEWIEIDGIHNEGVQRQIFPIGSRQRYIAYIDQFKYFKLSILENHGGPYNAFYEFAILGVRVE